MKKSQFENLPLIFASFIIATLIWAMIALSINPVIDDSINIPITIMNEEEIIKLNKSYVVKTPLICTLNYKIRSDQASNVSQADFKAYIDLKDLSTTNDLPVQYVAINEKDRNISFIKLEPKVVHVELEDAKRIEIPIKYKINGTIDEGHSVGDVIISPNILYVSGINELVKNISHALINVPIMNKNENFSDKAEIHLIDNDNNEMPINGLELSTNEANYSVTIFTRANVSLNAIVEGTPADGSTYHSTNVLPNTIMLEGPRSVIENIYTIDLPSVNIDGLSDSTVIELPISDVLPVGTRCKSVEKVQIIVDIENTVIHEPTAKNGIDNITVEEAS